jgi:hypothetical protein
MMPEQTLTKRQTGEIVAPNQGNRGVVPRHTQAKLAEVRSVIAAGVMAYDETYRQVEAYVDQGGRSPGHQKYIQERTSYLLVNHDLAVDKIVRRALEDIIAERLQVITRTRTVYVPEPRKSLFGFLTGG